MLKFTRCTRRETLQFIDAKTAINQPGMLWCKHGTRKFIGRSPAKILSALGAYVGLSIPHDSTEEILQ